MSTATLDRGRITARVPLSVQETLETAASLTGATLNQFVVQAALHEAERIIEVHWAPSPSSVFLVAIQVEALDRHRLLSDVTRVLADERVNILSASVTTSAGDRVAISRFTFEMGDPKHLGHLLDVVRNVEGVYDVYRVTSAA